MMGEESLRGAQGLDRIARGPPITGVTLPFASCGSSLFWDPVKLIGVGDRVGADSGRFRSYALKGLAASRLRC